MQSALFGVAATWEVCEASQRAGWGDPGRTGCGWASAVLSGGVRAPGGRQLGQVLRCPGLASTVCPHPREHPPRLANSVSHRDHAGMHPEKVDSGLEKAQHDRPLQPIDSWPGCGCDVSYRGYAVGLLPRTSAFSPARLLHSAPPSWPSLCLCCWSPIPSCSWCFFKAESVPQVAFEPHP